MTAPKSPEGTQTPGPGLRELAEKATPGPWVVQHNEGPDWWIDTHAYEEGPEPVVTPWYPADATDLTYIAAANPTAILGLLDRLAAAEARVAVLEDLLAYVWDRRNDHRDRHGRLAPGALCWCYRTDAQPHADGCKWLAARAATSEGDRG